MRLSAFRKRRAGTADAGGGKPTGTKTNPVLNEGRLTLPTREKRYRLQTYSQDHGTPAGASVWVENVPGEGEDAWPLFQYAPGLQCGVLGVADGMGASGTRKFLIDGQAVSGARVAADLAITGLAAAFQKYIGKAALAAFQGTAGEAVASPFQRLLETELGEAFAQKPRQLTRDPKWDEVSGRSLRLLPTTLSCLLYQVAEDAITVHVLWAGDTRCYAWTFAGLRQLSADDSRLGADPMESMQAGGPLVNYLSETKCPPKLNTRCYRFPKPVLVLAGSDGMHDCFRTPMHVEYALVRAGADAGSAEEFAFRLAKTLGGRASDDVSLAMAWVGWKHWDELRDAMRKRRDVLWQEYIGCLWQQEQEVHQELARVAELTKKRQEAQQRLNAQKAKLNAAEKAAWDTYRLHYEGFKLTGRSAGDDHNP